MSFTDNFGHPKGLLGRMMLVSMDKEHRPLMEWGFSQFELPKDANVIDIGCGGGYNVKRILARCPSGKAVGLDISEESVKKAKKVNKDELGKRCEILQGNVENMPFPDKRFDIATAVETVFFWPDPKENFKEVFRVLSEKGLFVVICNYGNSDIDWEKKVPCMTRYTAEQIAEFMKNAGFDFIGIKKRETFFCVIGKRVL